MDIDWYFDFVSPFAYLQLQRFDQLPPGTVVRPVPVLFAGILKHWGQLGPAEISGKRIFTYRYVHWLAERRGVALEMPPAHPFDPLPLLRLVVAAGPKLSTVRRLFDFVWREGRLPDSDGGRALDAVAVELGVDDRRRATSRPAAKAALIEHTRSALARGVFGVPTFVHGAELFWGDDATDMLLDYPERLIQRVRASDTLPIGAERPR